jgi:hypothetical protein
MKTKRLVAGESVSRIVFSVLENMEVVCFQTYCANQKPKVAL